MSKVTIMDHPLIQHKIGLIRRKETGSKDFRQLISEIAMLMCYEADQRSETDRCGDRYTDQSYDCKGTGR